MDKCTPAYRISGGGHDESIFAVCCFTAGGVFNGFRSARNPAVSKPEKLLEKRADCHSELQFNIRFGILGRSWGIFSMNVSTKKQKIINTARECFHRYGYAGTPVSAIVEASGVSMTSFYYHFKSKQALAMIIIEDLSREMEQDISELRKRS